MTRIVLLDTGASVLIDEADYDLVAGIEWREFANPHTSYAVGRRGTKGIFMHRLIAGAEKGEEVDHQDCNGLNNQRGNLRRCTRSQNQANRRNGRRSRAGYKGVAQLSPTRYRADICIDYQTTHLGYFDTATEAALAYDAAARRLFGEFAHPNFTTDKAPLPELIALERERNQRFVADQMPRFSPV